MTIDEAFDRVLRGHWLVILTCILIPFGVSLYLAKHAPSEYEAVARVQMGRELAASNVQADATSQRVLGIATSPGVVRLALDKAGLQTDVATFAANDIDVRRVGVSPVMEIAVTDTSPHRAAVIASSITSDVIQFSNVGDQPTVAQRRKAVQAQLDSITKQRQKLVAELATASPGDVLAIQAQLSSLTSSQTEYERQLSDLDLSILSSSRAVLLDPVREPTIPLSKDAAQKAVLAGLLGALLGLGLAAALEALRPRLPSGRAIARALDAPHVGRLTRRDLSARTTAAAERAADRLAMLARRYEADLLFLVPVADHDEAWARSLATHLGPGTSETSHRVECVVLDADWTDPGERPVAVVLAPEPVEGRALARAGSLVDALGWPVLGVLTYPRGRGRKARSVVIGAPTPRPLTASEGAAQPEPGRAGADVPDGSPAQTADGGRTAEGGRSADGGQAAEPARSTPAWFRWLRDSRSRSASRRAARSGPARARRDVEPGVESDVESDVESHPDQSFEQSRERAVASGPGPESDAAQAAGPTGPIEARDVGEPEAEVTTSPGSSESTPPVSEEVLQR